MLLGVHQLLEKSFVWNLPLTAHVLSKQTITIIIEHPHVSEVTNRKCTYIVGFGQPWWFLDEGFLSLCSVTSVMQEKHSNEYYPVQHTVPQTAEIQQRLDLFDVTIWGIIYWPPSHATVDIRAILTLHCSITTQIKCTLM